MPLLGPKMASAIQSALIAAGNVGTSVPVMSSAIGSGSVMSLVGKTFNTIDSGVGSGAGVGVGVGLFGVPGPSVSLMIQSAFLQEFGSMGTSVPMIADAIGQALEMELAGATLSSMHTPTYVGVGILEPGSLKVSASEWGSNIRNLAPALAGADWPRLASVIGKGCAQAMSTVTGQVTISGAGSPPPAPYSGPNNVKPSGVVS